jgi:hypothetical protein
MLITVTDADVRGCAYIDARSNHDRSWGAQLLGRTGVVMFEALDEQTDKRDVDQHALEVSCAIRFLQRHLERTLQRSVPPSEQDAVDFILHAVQWGTG